MKKGNRYKSVDEMVWKLSGWRFRIVWFWHKLWRSRNEK